MSETSREEPLQGRSAMGEQWGSDGAVTGMWVRGAVGDGLLAAMKLQRNVSWLQSLSGGDGSRVERDQLRVADNGVAASWSSIISSRSFLQFLQHNEQASKGKLWFFFSAHHSETGSSYQICVFSVSDAWNSPLTKLPKLPPQGSDAEIWAQHGHSADPSRFWALIDSSMFFWNEGYKTW